MYYVPHLQTQLAAMASITRSGTCGSSRRILSVSVSLHLSMSLYLSLSISLFLYLSQSLSVSLCLPLSPLLCFKNTYIAHTLSHTLTHTLSHTRRHASSDRLCPHISHPSLSRLSSCAPPRITHTRPTPGPTNARPMNDTPTSPSRVSHHLFPQVDWVHYPAISAITRQLCAEQVRHEASDMRP